MADDEVICASHIYLMSFVADDSETVVEIDGIPYRQIAKTTVPYLGYIQESSSYYIVNDKVYAQLFELCKQDAAYGEAFCMTYTYNYRIADNKRYADSLDELDGIVHNTDESYTGRVAIDPDSDEIVWIKVEFPIRHLAGRWQKSCVPPMGCRFCS